MAGDGAAISGAGDVAGEYGTYSVLVAYLVAGLILVGTYVWGVIVVIKRHGTAMKLWGSIAEKLWLLRTYYVSIAAAALGYLFNFAYALAVAPELPRWTSNLLCGSILSFHVVGIAWMPLCVEYLAKPRPAIYVCIRLVLALDGILALAWSGANLFAVPAAGAGEASDTWLRIMGCLGSVLYALHCAVLDAIVWPPFFR